VNDEAGARTNLAAIVSAGIIALTLLFLTPLFYYLPKAVLAAIIMVAVAGLIDWEEARYLWKVDRRDFGLMALTFVATLTLGIEQGILVGVIVSLIVVIYESSTPHTALMGRLPDTETYRNLKRNPDAMTRSHVVIVRMDANLYFANVSTFQDLILDLDVNDPALRAIVVDMYPVNQIDSTATHTLQEIIETCRRNGVQLYLAGVKGPVKDVLDAAGLSEELGEERFFLEVHDAVETAERDVEHMEETAPQESISTSS
jgi:SulP family sulfate permease